MVRISREKPFVCDVNWDHVKPCGRVPDHIPYADERCMCGCSITDYCGPGLDVILDDLKRRDQHRPPRRADRRKT